jgi:galactokinase
MDLPIKKGLSSSAAICVLAARAYNQLYNLGLSVREEMECAYQGELITGSQCGRMDQVCAYGQTPVFLTFDGEQMDVQPLAPAAPLCLVIVDLCRGKDTRKILHNLNTALMAPNAIGKGVRDALGPRNACILRRAREAVIAGDARQTGELMSEAQTLFDSQVAPACADELRSPKLHEVLSHPLVRELSWGGKGVGSQGDGCAQLVAHDANTQRRLIEQLPGALSVTCMELTIVRHERVAA